MCGKTVERYRCHLKRTIMVSCSRECNGVLRGAEWAKHGHKGRAAWTPEAVRNAAEKMTGPKNPSWRGGVTFKNSKGNYTGARYVRAPIEYRPMARRDGYIPEHRLVVAQAIGRLLTRTEVVHHINHDSMDNRLENLMLFACNRDHKRFEAHGSPPPIWQP